ncbi:MAG: MoxR family ATPase [Bacillota bacterium]|nr:MoxR family ATPase [Bacillota bacterium]
MATEQTRENRISEQEIKKVLEQEGYLVEDDLALVLSLADLLRKPLLLEGPAGVGKTDLARCLARGLHMELIRLQCYEGLDERHALYEWNYQKQLLYLESQKDGSWDTLEAELFSESFLLARPILKAFLSEQRAVLLIDEIDKSDEEFESFLLEALSDFAVTIPERGTVKARTKPLVILTSNGTRDFSDALKRRCVHYYIDYPPEEREAAILQARIPAIGERLSLDIARFVADLRRKSLRKKPSLAETLDWAEVLVSLGIGDLSNETITATYPFLLKYQEDLEWLKKEKKRK